jgi:hypothetical protein
MSVEKGSAERRECLAAFGPTAREILKVWANAENLQAFSRSLAAASLVSGSWRHLFREIAYLTIVSVIPLVRNASEGEGYFVLKCDITCLLLRYLP